MEGDTDKSVLEELAQKLGKPLDTAGISVLDMGGKGNLKVPSAMLRKLGIPAYIIADGDALGAARTHPTDAARETSSYASHKDATEKLMTWLPPSTNATHGSLPYAFMDSTVVCENYAVWEDDIENELAQWPSFVAAQATNSHAVRKKDMLAYRVDVVDADVADVPSALSGVIDAIHAFRGAV